MDNNMNMCMFDFESENLETFEQYSTENNCWVQTVLIVVTVNKLAIISVSFHIEIYKPALSDYLATRRQQRQAVNTDILLP